MRRTNRVGVEWQTPEGQNFAWEHVTLEVLMDIRAELRDLNATLRCHRVARMADAAIRIDRRLAKKMPLR